MPDEVVISATNDLYWCDFLLLYQSLRRLSESRMIVFDMGLQHYKRSLDQLCSDDGRVKVLHHTEVNCPIRDYFNHYWWPAFLKPWLIARAGEFCSRVLWLDADILILRGLTDFFRALEHGPVFVTQEFALPQSNQMFLDRDPAPCDQAVPNVCAAAIGLDTVRELSLLGEWQQRTRFDVENPLPDARPSDQAGLNWTLRKWGVFQSAHLGGEDWHQPFYPSGPEFAVLAGEIASGRTLIEVLADKYPMARLVHFWAHFKLRDLCTAWATHDDSITAYLEASTPH